MNITIVFDFKNYTGNQLRKIKKRYTVKRNLHYDKYWLVSSGEPEDQGWDLKGQIGNLRFLAV